MPTSTATATDAAADLTAQFFDAICDGRAADVRRLLIEADGGDLTAAGADADANGRQALTRGRQKPPPATRFDDAVELDAYRFLGAYLGAMTGLQLAVLKARDAFSCPRILDHARLADISLEMFIALSVHGFQIISPAGPRRHGQRHH